MTRYDDHIGGHLSSLGQLSSSHTCTHMHTHVHRYTHACTHSFLSLNLKVSIYKGVILPASRVKTQVSRKADAFWTVQLGRESRLLGGRPWLRQDPAVGRGAADPLPHSGTSCSVKPGSLSSQPGALSPCRCRPAPTQCLVLGKPPLSRVVVPLHLPLTARLRGNLGLTTCTSSVLYLPCLFVS